MSQVNETSAPAAASPDIIIIPQVESRQTSHPDPSPEPQVPTPAVTEQASEPKPLTSSHLTFNSGDDDTAATSMEDSRTLERREVDDLKRSNSILNRVSYFESANSSLVRPAKRSKSELDALQRHRVAAVLDNFERSDTVLLGRQAPEAGDVHLLQQLRAGNEPEANNAPAAPPPPPVAGDAKHSGADVTEDPVYAVPDRSRKSEKSQPRSRPTSDAASDNVIPEVPNKSDD